jgi:hypothetical protein
VQFHPKDFHCYDLENPTVELILSKLTIEIILVIIFKSQHTTILKKIMQSLRDLILCAKQVFYKLQFYLKSRCKMISSVASLQFYSAIFYYSSSLKQIWLDKFDWPQCFLYCEPPKIPKNFMCVRKVNVTE